MNYNEFKHIISRTSNVPVQEISDDSSLRDDLNIDSLSMVNLIVEVAEKYRIDLGNLKSSEDIQTVEKMYRTLMGVGDS